MPPSCRAANRDNPRCTQRGGGGSIISGPAALPTPKTLVIRASKGTRWNVLVANPALATGFSTSPGS